MPGRLMLQLRMLVSLVVALSILVARGESRFANATEKYGADDPVACGAIVQRCMGRCDERERNGDEGVQYVQWITNFVKLATACVVHTTTGNEMVSANPPNDDKTVVVFNVPCCQQKPLPGEPRNIPCPATVTPKSSTSIPTTTTSTTAASPNVPLCPEKQVDLKENNIKEDVNLTFSILCFILLLIILLLLVKKLIKKKFRKKTFNNPENESSAAMSNMSNGGVHITMASDLVDEKQERNAQEVLNETVKSIPPPKSHEYQNSEPATGSKFQPRDDGNNLDYVVLEPVESPPPKSARSRSRGQSAEKSEEVLIIGGGRGNVYRNDPTSSPVIPNGTVLNFEVKYDATSSPMFSLENTPTNTIQPQLPGRNTDMINTRTDFSKRRSDSLPETRAPPGEIEYDKLGTGISEDAESVEPVSRASAANRSFGTSSLDGAPLQKSTNIYNVLDNGDKNDKRKEYYQRLKRSQRARPKELGQENTEITAEEANLPTPTPSYEDDYVKDFEILKKGPRPDGKEETALPNIAEQTNRSGYVFAKDVQHNGTIPNGSPTLLDSNKQIKHTNSTEGSKEQTAGTKLLETEEL